MHYYFSIDELKSARGENAELAFNGHSPEALAEILQKALRDPDLWERWRATQPEPDEIDPSTGATDPNAVVTAEQSDLHTDVEVLTTLPHAIIKHRLTLLVGRNWKLHDVCAR